MADNQKFSVTRKDLAFDFANTFDDVFNFATFDSEECTPLDGIRFNEKMGYDFQNECTPVIEIRPLTEELVKQVEVNLSDLHAVVTIEDRGLAIRKLIFDIPVKEITNPKKLNIILKEHHELSFNQGFEINCFLSRANSLPNNESLFWHKSQIIHQTNFIVQATIDNALFELSWTDFADEQEKKNLFYYVKWDDELQAGDVSSKIDIDCFKVMVNTKFRNQFKRLESNKIGQLSIRMMGEAILKELMQQCMRFAKIDDSDPEDDSLHDKLNKLCKGSTYTFDDLAKYAQSANESDQMIASQEATKILQNYFNIGSNLDVINFGGFR